jgi:pantetheine-phosphate adenylyltransferase
MERYAIYPGSFDPITYGHIDVIERGCRLFDKVYVVVAVNSKKVTLFDEDERFDMIENTLRHLDNVEVLIHRDLTVKIANEKGAVAMIRGIRAISDFEYEFQIALMNRKLDSKVDTVFLAPSEQYTYLNSSIVRELARYGRDTSMFVPDYVASKLKEKFEGIKP